MPNEHKNVRILTSTFFESEPTISMSEPDKTYNRGEDEEEEANVEQHATTRLIESVVHGTPVDSNVPVARPTEHPTTNVSNLVVPPLRVHCLDVLLFGCLVVWALT